MLSWFIEVAHWDNNQHVAPLRHVILIYRGSSLRQQSTCHSTKTRYPEFKSTRLLLLNVASLTEKHQIPMWLSLVWSIRGTNNLQHPGDQQSTTSGGPIIYNIRGTNNLQHPGDQQSLVWSIRGLDQQSTTSGSWTNNLWSDPSGGWTDNLQHLRREANHYTMNTDVFFMES